MPNFKSKFGRVALRRLRQEYFVWLTTVDATGTPQPRPVWFIRENDSILIYSQAKAHKLKHIRDHSRVSLHFNTADDLGENKVIVLTGEAKVDDECRPAHRHRAYMKKYGTGIARLGATPEQFAAEYSVGIRITPTKLRGWE
jgi:PPOX class probable F420-dependent enzyme